MQGTGFAGFTVTAKVKNNPSHWWAGTATAVGGTPDLFVAEVTYRGTLVEEGKEPGPRAARDISVTVTNTTSEESDPVIVTDISDVP